MLLQSSALKPSTGETVPVLAINYFDSVRDFQWGLNGHFKLFTVPIVQGTSLEEVIEDVLSSLTHRTDTDLKHFEDVIKFSVNIALYSTHPTADCEALHQSPEFQKLYKKAHKAKGARRKNLFKDFNKAKQSGVIVLGGNVNVSRTEREVLTEQSLRKGTGKKHRVRTLVASHWQHYWKGARDSTKRVRTYMRKEAYWKGPELAPITHKTRNLV